jgi:apolipoprotein D and lipocalin family protein
MGRECAKWYFITRSLLVPAIVTPKMRSPGLLSRSFSGSDRSMRTFVPLLLLLLALPAQSQSRQPTAVEHADVDRYMGQWYEIARLPNQLERHCARDVVSIYERRSESAIRVTYVCSQADGEEERTRGVARIRDAGSNAKLELRFAPLALAWWPFVWDDWWILELAPEYTHMMVGDPSRQTLWIFSRTREMDDATYQALIAHAAAQGYDTQHLVKTPQSKP